MSILEAHDLYRFFHTGDAETLALRGVSLTVDRGEVVAVTGPSGSGKSTLLNCLAGLDDPDGGMVLVAGERLSRRPERERSRLRAAHIGMLFQSDNLFDHLTLTANITLAGQAARTGAKSGARHRDKPPAAGRAAMAQQADELVERFGLSTRRHARPSQLSGGEAARAGLAVALANSPQVLLADEPTGELDSATAAMVMDELHRLAEEGLAIVVVTHSPTVADGAHRIVRLRDGQVQP